MSYELIAILMFSSMMLMLMTGQRVFGAIGAVAAVAALTLWGTGGSDIPFSSAMKLMKWYPLLTLPMFIFMGYVLSESRIADDLYQMFHVWMGNINGGLAIGTIGLMILVSAMNGQRKRPGPQFCDVDTDSDNVIPGHGPEEIHFQRACWQGDVDIEHRALYGRPQSRR